MHSLCFPSVRKRASSQLRPIVCTSKLRFTSCIQRSWRLSAKWTYILIYCMPYAPLWLPLTDSNRSCRRGSRGGLFLHSCWSYLIRLAWAALAVVERSPLCCFVVLFLASVFDFLIYARKHTTTRECTSPRPRNIADGAFR